MKNTAVKDFVAFSPGPNVIKFLCLLFTNCRNKPECLLDLVRKACQEQTLYLIMKIKKKFCRIVTWSSTIGLLACVCERANPKRLTPIRAAVPMLMMLRRPGVKVKKTIPL